ncbi:hypothetical protein [Marinobacterium jannaschii]|uniref:hypothetical protein n=1 Tax=Marinobacterium jannaschii TaxID=64970 RepID=UPI000AE038E8|nr:hypothetical protein [Marinobacterium jannaschii]
MIRKTIFAALALSLSATVVAAPDSYQDAFELNRAMYGKGHTFVWQGKEYSTDHPEEIEAAVEANAANAAALIASAKAKNAEVAKLNFEWKLTRDIIKKAEAAAAKGEFRKALNLAAQAKYHARMGIEQYHYAQANWHLSVPE